MRNWLPAIALAIVTSLSLAPTVADAKRLGGGSSSGLQRSMPTAPPAKPAAPQQAAPTTAPAPAGAAAAAPKRNWLGPVAGLAAGLGLAALFSHLGLGEEFASFLMLALLAMVAFVAIRFLMGRMGRPQPAAAMGRIEPTTAQAPQSAAPPLARTATAPAQGAELSADGSTRLAPIGGGTARPTSLPAGFDADSFARVAKTIFIRMQAANDAGDLNDLRAFTTPEMFAVARLDIQDRGARAQTTDVVQVDAEVVDFEQAGERQIVSVRYHGRIREEADGSVTDFDEVWHLQRWGDDPNWKIAGIQQMA